MIKIGKSASNISIYSCQPKDTEELIEIIQNRLKQKAKNSILDLSDIDTSRIYDDEESLWYDLLNDALITKSITNVINQNYFIDTMQCL